MKNSYNKGLNFELTVKNIYTQLLKHENINVYHQKVYIGKTGQKYSIDLSFEFKKAMVSFLVLIECKYYNTAVHVGDVLEFAAKLEDIGAHKGIIASNKGFQRGALTVALGKKIALVKVYRSGELDPIVSLTGPKLYEMLYYFVDFQYVAKDKNISLHAVISPDINSLGTKIYEIAKKSIISDKNQIKIEEEENLISYMFIDDMFNDDLPIWYDWEKIVTPKKQIFAKIRFSSLVRDKKFKKIKCKGKKAIKSALKLHELNNNDGAIAKIEKISKCIETTFLNSEYDPKVSLNDLPKCIYWLGHFYLSRAIHQCPSSSWGNEKRTFEQNIDLIKAERLYNEFEYQLILLGHGESRIQNTKLLFSDLAQVYYYLNRLDESETGFKKSILVQPNNALSYFALGLFYLLTKQYDSAINIFQEILLKKLVPKNQSGSIYYNIACGYSHLNDPMKAIDYLKKAIELKENCRKIALNDNDLNNIKDLKEFKELFIL